MDKYIHERFAEEVINDYFTANVKTEVILDTILTPVIGEILTVVCKEECRAEDAIDSNMKQLAKEFPILEKTEGDKETFRSCNADYLMCDHRSVYFVELKTTQDSYSESQMENYIKKCGKNVTFAEKLWDFVRLLNHVSKNRISDSDLRNRLNKNRENEADWEVGKDDLKWLFEKIVVYPDEVKPVKELWNEQEKHENRAKCYLQREGAVSSKKYLFTAGQMLDHMTEKYGNWWNSGEIKLICITPAELPNKKKLDGIIYLTFQKIIEKRKEIGKKIETEKKDLKNYWEWAADILEQCMYCYDSKLKSECPKHKKDCELECGRQAENKE